MTVDAQQSTTTAAPGRPAETAEPPRSKQEEGGSIWLSAVMGLVVAALVCIPRTPTTLADNSANSGLYDQLIDCGLAAIAVIFAARLSVRLRLVCIAATLALAGALFFGLSLVALNMDPFTTGPTPFWIRIAPALTGASWALAIGLGASVALNSARGGILSAAALVSASSLATALGSAATIVGRSFNPDFVFPTPAFAAITHAGGALIAGLALLMLLGNWRPPGLRSGRSHHSNIGEIARASWRTPSSRWIIIALLLQVCLLGAIEFCWYTAPSGPEPATPWNPFGRLLLAELAVPFGLLAGALFAQPVRRQPDRLAARAMWIVGAGALTLVFANSLADGAQSRLFLALAAGLLSANGVVAYAAVSDRFSQHDRATAVATLVFLLPLVGVIGLPMLLGAIAVKLGGAASWTMLIGFWGHVGGVFPREFLLPIQVDLSVGDTTAAPHVQHTACIVLIVALAVPFIWYRLASGSAKSAIPSQGSLICSRCGIANEAGSRFCLECGGHLASIPPREPSSSWNPVSAILLGAAAGSVLALAAAWADADGVLHERWTSAATWQAPDAAVDAIKACNDKDWACLFAAMRANRAPDQAVRLMQTIALRAAPQALGYPNAINGRGRVKVVEVVEPSMGQGGASEFVFVNGTAPAVSASEDVQALADASADFQNFKQQYPQAMIWNDMSFHKEVIATDGSQQFQFQFMLLDGCHMCGVLGQLEVGYNFDRRGHYTGMTIASVEADKSAPYASVRDRLARETLFNQTFTLSQPDGTVATAPWQSSLQEKNHCRFAITGSGNMFTGAFYTLDNAFGVGDVTIENTALYNAAAAVRAAAADAAAAAAAARAAVNHTAPLPVVPLPNPPPQPPPPINSLSIACKDTKLCISQDFSDARGHAPPLSVVTFIVPVGNVDAVTRDFQALQAMCAER